MQWLRFFSSSLLDKSALCAALILAACTTAPVQEMSDARQAIRSAEAAGAAQRSLVTLREAQRLLQAAQIRLESGAYDEARRAALAARANAIKAREQALQNPAPEPTTP
ncbi:MAG: DUF4398 domain-containing protein [Candidatus Competibacteraceae bacterium]